VEPEPREQDPIHPVEIEEDPEQVDHEYLDLDP
jgi:hypothetical protein